MLEPNALILIQQLVLATNVLKTLIFTTVFASRKNQALSKYQAQTIILSLQIVTCLPRKFQLRIVNSLIQTIQVFVWSVYQIILL